MRVKSFVQFLTYTEMTLVRRLCGDYGDHRQPGSRRAFFQNHHDDVCSCNSRLLLPSPATIHAYDFAKLCMKNTINNAMTASDNVCYLRASLKPRGPLLVW